MTEEQPKDFADSEYYHAIRQVAHSVGLRIVRERDYFKAGSGSVGIHHWSYKVQEEIKRLAKAGRWDFKDVSGHPLIPDVEDTIPKRINEISNEKECLRLEGHPPYWRHLQFKYWDVDPVNRTTRYQSTYRLTEAFNSQAS